MLTNQTVSRFLNELASAPPAPGKAHSFPYYCINNIFFTAVKYPVSRRLKYKS